MTSGSGKDKPKASGRRIALGVSLAWGPGLLVALVVYFTTKSVPLSVLAFAVVTAITAIVLGATGSVLMKRRQERR